MRLSLSNLRTLISEAIGASASYMKREKIREDLQRRVVDAVISGDINDEGDLQEYFETIDMAVKALKMIPYEVFTKIAKQRRK
jgi:hypothetical protein